MTGDKTRIKKVRTAGFLTEDYTYDGESRVNEYKQTVDYRESYPMTTSYVYDSLDRVKEVHYPAQYGLSGNPRKIVAHTYDTASRLTQMTYGGAVQASDMVLNASGQATQIKIGEAGTNQVTEEYTFDPQTGLLTNQTAKKNGTTTLLNLSYEYTRLGSVGNLNGKTGHLTRIIDNLNNNKNREYEFDAVGRLTKAKGGATGTLWDQNYTYDRYGNRTNVTASGVAADSSPIPLDGLPNLAYDNTSNRITTAGFQYDSAGNQTSGFGADGTALLFEYDAANRVQIIKKESDGSILQAFQYGSTNARLIDYDGVAGLNKFYASTGGTTLAEYTEFAHTVPTWTKTYTYLGSTQLATVTPNGTGGEYVEFNHPDRLGTRLQTNQAGGTSYEQSTLPFGTALNAESTVQNNNKRFTSYDRSNATGLDYAVNRTYDSKQGRFTQIDPIGMSAVSLMAPQTLNMYNYCGNDPINYIDPSGLSFGSFFRWLGNLIMSLFRSRVARRIAIRFVVNYVVSGGNFGVAVRSIVPDILSALGLAPPRYAVTPGWNSNLPYPYTLGGISPLSKYIIKNLMSALSNLECDDKILQKFALGDSNLYRATDEDNLNFIHKDAADSFHMAVAEIYNEPTPGLALAFADVFRDSAMQQRRYDTMVNDGGPDAAKPGRGAHEAGMAVDAYMPHVNPTVIAIFKKHGWNRTRMGSNVAKSRREPWHFEWKGFSSGAVSAAQAYYQNCILNPK